MLFCSPEFCVFFVIVFAAHWLLPSNRARVWLLLVASVYFYACWNRWLAVLLVASSSIDYALALGIEAAGGQRWRKTLLGMSLAGNLGLLGYFKYANFFLRSLEDAAASLGLEASLPTLRVILPIGISFYTFEAINYTVDVYLRRIRAERNLANFLLFILFFPHLVAGPIVRARDFLPLVARRKRWSWLRANFGLRLIVMGLFKKLAIADCLGRYVDPVYADPMFFSSGTLWATSVAYAVQVYCDFSGYSDMALGLAHLLGYHLARNFNMPFAAANISDFWRRWHMSLSNWIRDYVYIPLGGSRGSRWQTIRNLLIAMTLCGLWHGASWNFVIWGLLTGVMLAAHFAFRRWCEGRPALATALRTPAGTALRVAMTFTAFCLSMVIFRSEGLPQAGQTLQRMLIPSTGAGLPLQPHGLAEMLLLVALCHVVALRARWRDVWERLPVPLRGVGIGSVTALALVLAPHASKAYIYFQF